MRRRKNSIDDEIRELERREADLTDAERTRLDSLLARAGRPRRVLLEADEVPDLDEFLARAETWREEGPASYAIDTDDDRDGFMVDAMVRTGDHTTNFGDYASRREGILAVSASRSGTIMEIEVLKFDDHEAVWLYVERLNGLATGELEIDDGLGAMQPETSEGVWYTGDTNSGGFEIPPDLIDLSDLGVLPVIGGEGGEAIRVENDLREAVDLLDNAQSQEDIDLAQAEIDRLEEIQERTKNYIEGDRIDEIRAEQGWGARLTMPGYMDSTSWHAVYRTERAALDALFEDESEAISPEEQDRLRLRASAMATEILAAYGYDRLEQRP
jgi:hypothetical protein